MISVGSLVVSWFYGIHRKILIEIKAQISILIFGFILSYAFFAGSGERGVMAFIMVFGVFSLSSGIVAALIRFFIKEEWYPKYLVLIGGVIVLFSLVSYLLTFLYLFTVPSDFIIYEMEYSSRFEAYFKYFLPWLLRMSALLMQGLFSATIGYVLWKKNLDRFYTIIQGEAYIFLFFVVSELIHSVIFGRRLMI